ncbi:MAG TPA: zinc-dependent metalloprotease [Flavipsychrobacter sp.]|nr:zinc-dependent metalloprotease [Flavipsychrobacter sp.]
MKKLLTLLACQFVLIGSSYAQSLAEQGCGTVTTEAQMDRVHRYVANEDAVRAKTTAGVDSIPLSIHIVGTTAGTGYYELEKLFPLLCKLNNDFAPTGFHFYVVWPIHYINNDNYYIHTFGGGYQMMANYNIANTVNVYFVEDPAGNCGYFSPSVDGVAIGKNCAAINSTTLTHELGHFFDLPHTFYGWENGNTPSIKERVTRTTGANCNVAGDGFCDTDADYLSYRWQCPYSGVTLYDPVGVALRPDSSLYMSYTTDACMSRFSNQQMGTMQSNLYNQRPNLLSFSYPSYSAMDTPNLITPSDTMYGSNTTVRWNKVNGAQYYQIVVTLKNITSIIRQRSLTTDTFINLNFPLVDAEYIVNVIPLNARNLCGEKTRKHPFVYRTNDPTGIHDVYSNNLLAAYPNPANNTLTLSHQNLNAGEYQLQILNVGGQVVRNETIKYKGGSAAVSHIDVSNLINGMYHVRLTGKGLNTVSKFFVQH